MTNCTQPVLSSIHSRRPARRRDGSSATDPLTMGFSLGAQLTFTVIFILFIHLIAAKADTEGFASYFQSHSYIHSCRHQIVNVLKKFRSSFAQHFYCGSLALLGLPSRQPCEVGHLFSLDRWEVWPKAIGRVLGIRACVGTCTQASY